MLQVWGQPHGLHETPRGTLTWVWGSWDCCAQGSSSCRDHFYFAMLRPRVGIRRLNKEEKDVVTWRALVFMLWCIFGL